MNTLRRFGFTPALCLIAFSAVSCGGDSPEEAGAPVTASPAVEAEPSEMASMAGDATSPESPAGGGAIAAPRQNPRAQAPTSSSAPPSPPAPEDDMEGMAMDDEGDEMPAAEPAFIAAGTTLTFAMEAPISTDKNKAGDMFSAKLVADVLSEDGRVLLPMGAVLLGRVTESVESPSADQPAMLRLAVESIEARGSAYSVVGEIEQVQMQAEARDSNRRTAATAAAGAAAGAVLGRITGRTKTGAVAGAAAGVAVALATRDGQATIPSGAQLTVRLSERLIIR